ncbi:MAG: HPr family phosphocarrier protein [Candidatus Adiutrix sp.]|jgi:phosphotransferase system HPr (HPr) family protein|nr:HPr family phosphocarrier protein [Candidatus Adiutrix sp.]
MDRPVSSSAELTIKNRLGLHARAAAQLVRAASCFQAAIRLVKNGEAADARSVLGLISLGCAYDSLVTIEAEGVDAHLAIQALTTIIEDRFGEE